MFGPVADIPTDLQVALSHALRIISWQENLVEDEMPPDWMWSLEWELEVWFEDLKRARQEKYGGGGGSSDYEPPMMQNELAAERFGR